MSEPVKVAIPPQTTPWVNDRNNVNPDWYIAIIQLLKRIGGTARDLVAESIRVTGAGIVVSTDPTGNGDATTRSIVGGPGIDIVDGDGVAGNPTVYRLGPDNFGFFVGGLMSDGELLGSAIYDADVLFPSVLKTPTVKSEFPATASAVFNIKSLNGGVETTRGTITFAAGGTLGTVAWGGGSYTLPAGDRLKLYAPATHDTTLSMVTGLVPGDLS